MKLRLYGLAFPIILMFNPVAHCFWGYAVIQAVRENKQYLVNLMESNNEEIRNYVSLVATMKNLVNKLKDKINNINLRILGYEVDMRNMCSDIVGRDNLHLLQLEGFLKTYDQKITTYNNNVGGEVQRSLVELKGSLNREEVRNYHRFNDLWTLNKRLVEIKDSLVLTKETIHNSLRQAVSTTELADNNIMLQLEALHREVYSMSEKKSMMLSSFDKRNAATGASFLEIKELINAKAQQLNEKLNNGFVNICEDKPLEIGNQISTLLTKVNKIESEVNHLSCDVNDIYNEVPAKNENKQQADMMIFPYLKKGL